MSAEVLRYAAFTEHGRGGNPAGVVLEADALTPPQMLSVARAVGFSETAFVLEEATHLRFFSPRAEVAFCGHATVAAAVALTERLGGARRELRTMAGPVDVLTDTSGEQIVATLTSQPATTRPARHDVIEEALACLGWAESQLDQRFPVHVANAGNDHLVLGVANLATLADYAYDYDRLSALMDREGWTTVHAFVATRPAEFRARNAFPPGGVREDPATGAAAAAFGGYLRDLGLLPDDRRFTIHQGVELGRPSRLDVEVAPSDLRVFVSGAATRLPASTDDTMPLL